MVDRLCRSYQVSLHCYLTKMVGSWDTAQELAQESFERIYKAYSAEEVLFPRAVLFRIATNVARMHLRRRRMQYQYWGQQIDIESMEEIVGNWRLPSADREILASQIGRYIGLTIKNLSPGVRSVFVMAHIQGKSRKEIAGALRVSEKRVDKRMSRALSVCRAVLLLHDIHLGDVDSACDLMRVVAGFIDDRC